MSIQPAKPSHEALYQDLCALLTKHTADLPAHEVLAVAANMLGKIVALQDQRTMTPEQAMEIVAQNIEHGNKEVLAQLSATRGRA